MKKKKTKVIIRISFRQGGIQDRRYKVEQSLSIMLQKIKSTMKEQWLCITGAQVIKNQIHFKKLVKVKRLRKAQ